MLIDDYRPNQLNEPREEGSSYVTPSVSDKKEPREMDQTVRPQRRKADTESQPNVIVAGMLAIDYACDHTPLEGSKSRDLELHTSNPAVITQGLGGVGHNIARAAQLAGVRVRLCSAVGEGVDGDAALEALEGEGMDASGIAVMPKSSAKRTARYVAVNNGSKDLVVAMADMTIFDPNTQGSNDTIHDTLSSLWLPQLERARPSHLVIDANWPPRYLSSWLRSGAELGAHVTFEPVSNAKSSRIFQLPTAARQPASETLSVFPLASIQLTTPNQYELSSMYDTARERGFFEREEWWHVVDAFGISSSGARAQLVLATTGDLVDRGIPQKSLQLLPYIPCITTKLGREGVLLTQIIPAGDARLSDARHAPYILSRCNNETEEAVGVGGVYMRLFPPPELVEDDEVVSVNGVGDTFAGVLIASLAGKRKGTAQGNVEDFIDKAQRASILTLRSKDAVSPGVGTLGMLM